MLKFQLSKQIDNKITESNLWLEMRRIFYVSDSCPFDTISVAEKIGNQNERIGGFVIRSDKHTNGIFIQRLNASYYTW